MKKDKSEHPKKPEKSKGISKTTTTVVDKSNVKNATSTVAGLTNELRQVKDELKKAEDKLEKISKENDVGFLEIEVKKDQVALFEISKEIQSSMMKFGDVTKDENLKQNNHDDYIKKGKEALNGVKVSNNKFINGFRTYQSDYDTYIQTVKVCNQVIEESDKNLKAQQKRIHTFFNHSKVKEFEADAGIDLTNEETLTSTPQIK